MNKTCQMTMGSYDEGYYPCGKPAKFTTKSRPGGNDIYLCGIHARALSRTNASQRVKIKQRIIPL